MASFITHNVTLHGFSIQSYTQPDTGKVVLDFNGFEPGSYQVWLIEDARAIATLLALAIADAELKS